jgi:hypothetical protein
MMFRWGTMGMDHSGWHLGTHHPRILISLSG